jgi:phosphohistidine swiveling domain-containing protein
VTHLVVDLDDPIALDPMVAGAKAAWLARGRRAGLPVLPGLVLIAAASETPIELGWERLQEGGSGQARLAISEGGLPDEVALALKRIKIGWPRLVVRSSSLLEDAGEWSGAFATYLDVGPADLPTTILGCWASVFSVATIERCRLAGKEPAAMGVVIQPFIVAKAGGTADVKDGAVTIHTVEGSPAGLLSGRRRGHTTVVDRSSGAVTGYQNPKVEEMARLAIEVQALTGANSMEWATNRNGELFILQLTKSYRPGAGDAEMVTPDHPDLIRVARTIRRFPGATGAEMVLPWALGLSEPSLLDDVEALPATDPDAALAEARSVGRTLTNQVWESPVGDQLAAAYLAELAGDAAAALSRIGRLPSPSATGAARVVGLIRGAGLTLSQRKAIGHPDEIWYSELARSPALWLGIDRWEPLGAAVTAAHGSRAGGLAAGAGVGFGRAQLVDERSLGPIGPRRVIVAPDPIPHLAPLLWSAAGLVTFDGSPAAHLFEAARSLGVPAIAAVDLDPAVLASGDWAVAVDGNQGTVSIMEW